MRRQEDSWNIMNGSIQVIPIARLMVAFVPVTIVMVVFYRWSMEGRTVVLAVGRMLIQLILIGYVLVFIFEAKHPSMVVGVLSIMLAVAGWIAMRPLADRRTGLYPKALGAIALGGVSTLALVTQVVLDLDPWFLPRYLVPLGGMIFANSMNCVSLAAERFESEIKERASYPEARRIAFRASLIPMVNSLFAVGIVSIPGMMTGQILSGVSPLLAARYQIVVMCMVFGSSGIASAVYLTWSRSAGSKVEPN